METEFVKIVREHDLIRPGQKLLVAVSGGPDSVALLALFRRQAQLLGISLAAAHLDHGIRRESAEDARFVKDLCAELGIELICGEADVPALAQARKEGLEAAGRQARMDFLVQSAEAHGCDKIALGHHRGDQVETVLHRLLRGSGVSGLAAMAWQRDRFIRPLLGFARERLLDFLVEQRLPYRLDASNCDPAFTRNRIRHQLLPLLRSFNPRIEEHLADFSQRVALEEDYWRQQESQALAAARRPCDSGLRLDRQVLLSLQPALRIRVLRRALELARGDLLALGADHLEAVEALLFKPRPQADLHLPRAWVGRRYESVWFRPSAPEEPEPFDFSIPGPGSYALPDGRRLEFLLTAAGREAPDALEFSLEDVAFPLQVRSFRPGDRFRPDGDGGEK
ncbi:MAG: tRNA lysidine(34) synthetase TilS [Desulfuromonadaceae bacterium]